MAHFKQSPPKLWGHPFVGSWYHGVCPRMGSFFSGSTHLFTLLGGDRCYESNWYPLWNLYKRTQTTYVLTDRRIAIHRDGISGNTYSYHLNTLGNLTFQRERSGRGSISLSGDPIAFGNVNPNRNTVTTAELSAVQNVAQVYELIIAAKEKSAVHEMPVLTENPAASRRVW